MKSILLNQFCENQSKMAAQPEKSGKLTVKLGKMSLRLPETSVFRICFRASDLKL